MTPYPIAAYRQLFPDGKKGLLPPFDPAEDGDHYRSDPDFFEWWYFDAAFEDGSYLIAAFHSSLYNAVDHRPILDLHYCSPDNPPVVAMARFDRAAYRAEPDRCWVKIGDCLAADEGNCYRLSLHQGPLAGELTFWPQLLGWKAGTGHLFADPVSGRHFTWVVPLPRARVEGELAIAGQRRPLAGVGYHDHNWGDLYLPAAFSGWTWGRVLADDWTLIFGDAVGRGVSSPHVTPFLLARGDEILLTTDRIRFRGEESARESQSGADHLRRLHLTTAEGPALELTLTARRLIGALDFAAPHLPLTGHPHMRRAVEGVCYLARGKPIIGCLVARLLGKGSYSRWDADYRLDLPDHDIVETGQALYEVMQL